MCPMNENYPEPSICPDCRGDYYDLGFYCRECNVTVCPQCWDLDHHLHDIEQAKVEEGDWFWLIWHKED